MSKNEIDLLEQLDRHLTSSSQAWLFGAGISFNAGIPLMIPLTARIKNKAAASKFEKVLELLVADLPSDHHIEHILSQLGDYDALARRSTKSEINISGNPVALSLLAETHEQIVGWIGETIRWGYMPANGDKEEEIGSFANPLVSVSEHRDFVRSLFRTNQAGLQDRRGPVRIFTTNYDTLLEDALALESVSYWDGFSGGAIAFRDFHFGEQVPTERYRAHVVKLHGSIDWHLGQDGKVLRVRDGDAYPSRVGRVLIYPQATKYVATQMDPFAVQFDLFRRALATSSDNVLCICGYSFGDEHINQEIELAISNPSNRTTVLAFFWESEVWPHSLDKWRKSAWGKRVYVATQNGLYCGRQGPFCAPEEGSTRDWWTFSGLAKLLSNGIEGVV